MSSVPGQSCRDIKDSGDFDLSGTYWIRPAGSRDSFQAYCDMSAVGRKFCGYIKSDSRNSDIV